MSNLTFPTPRSEQSVGDRSKAGGAREFDSCTAPAGRAQVMGRTACCSAQKTAAPR